MKKWLLMVVIMFSGGSLSLPKTIAQHGESSRPMITPDNADQVALLAALESGIGTGGIAFNADGTLLATTNGTIRVWDVGMALQGNPPLAVISGGGGEGLAFHPTEPLLVAANWGNCVTDQWDGVARYWDIRDLATPVEITLYPVHNCGQNVTFSEDGMLMALGGEHVIMVDVASGAVVGNIVTGLTGGAEVYFLPNARVMLWTGGVIFVLSLADILAAPEGYFLEDYVEDERLWIPNTFDAFSMALSADGSRFTMLQCLACETDTLDIRAVATGETLVSLETAEGQLTKRYFTNEVAFSPDGRLVAAGACVENGERTCLRAVVHVWDAETGALLNTLDGHTQDIVDIEFSPDGALLVSTARNVMAIPGPNPTPDAYVRVWGIPTAE